MKWLPRLLLGLSALVGGCVEVSLVTPREVCDDNIDNDADGRFDCADSDCAQDLACADVIEQICNDAIDNDNDLLTDCQDPDCVDAPNCQPEAEVCDDNIDNDFDGAFDCGDADCVTSSLCQELGNCNDNEDNDGDSLTDCADPDCAQDAACQVNICGDSNIVFPEECDPPNSVSCDAQCRIFPESGFCGDNADNDLDGLIDCQDLDCIADPQCPFGAVEICDDFFDDDNDGLIDCADPDCTAVCAGGTRVTGDPCNGPGDCNADPSNTPLCISEAFGFPSGYCSESCDLASPTCTTGNMLDGQPADGLCLDSGGGSGLCFDRCNPANGDTECRVGYACQDFGFIGLCFPACTDDSQCPDTGHCDTNPQSDTFGNCTVLEICDNVLDDDFDGLLDCLDPDCAQDAACQPGNNNTGLACDAANDCTANNSDPFCFDEVGQGFPGGYCSEFCDIAAQDCAVGATCLDVSGDGSLGLCFDLCDPSVNPPQSDCRGGYNCFDISGQGVCVNACTDDSQCPATNHCEASSGLCRFSEVCDDNLDNDQDGLRDCADNLDCSNDPACEEAGRCNDDVDNDLDGGIDCQDFDCAFDAACVAVCGDGNITVPETCDPPNNISCDAQCRNIPESNRCDDSADNDLDGLVDCVDLDCAFNPVCPFGAVEICDDFFDDDNDGLIDCADPDCATFCAGGSGVTGDPCVGPSDCAAAPGNNEQCINEATNGFPGGYCSEICDLANPSCVSGTSVSGQPADGICIDAGLATGDGLCFDACDLNNSLSDCRAGYVCVDAFGNGQGLCVTFCNSDAQCPQTGHCDQATSVCTVVENCVNGIDDDRDGGTDCDDNECFGAANCPLAVCGDGVVTAPEVCDPADNITCDASCQRIPETARCNDAQDNDGDGLIDCLDVDCAGNASCQGVEICNNFVDDDGDALPDCLDPDCLAVCQGGAGVTGDSCLGPNDCASAFPGANQCLDEGTDGFPGGYCTEGCSLLLPACVAGTTDLGQPADGLCKDVGGGALGLCFDACDTSLDCRDGYVCFDGFNDGQKVCLGFCNNDNQCPQTGNCNVDIGVCTLPESCTNGVDDDRDTLADCADPDCVQDPTCPAAVCGDGVVVFPEQCEPPDTAGCDSFCNITVVQEICQNAPNDLTDDDQDGFSDCSDTDCQSDLVCQPGNNLTGAACSAHSDCGSNQNADPACLDQGLPGVAVNGFPGGYCSEFCGLAGGNNCQAGARCKDVNLGNGDGMCFDSCSNNNQCRTGYTCSNALGNPRVCLPQ